MNMRRWLAKKLYPEAFRDAERGDYLRRRMDELAQWCGYGFPEIKAAIEWMQRSEYIHFMPLDEFDALVRSGRYNEVAVGTIDRFRDEISDRFDRRPERRAA